MSGGSAAYYDSAALRKSTTRQLRLKPSSDLTSTVVRIVRELGGDGHDPPVPVADIQFILSHTFNITREHGK